MKFILFFLLLLPLMSFSEENISEFPKQQTNLATFKQENIQDKSRPILNAPSLRIPAAPAYETTLRKLGYKNKDDLLKQNIQAQGGVNSVAFDGQGYIASGSDDGTVRLWNTKSRQLKQTLQVQGRVLSVDFDNQGHIASGSDDGTVRLWGVKSGLLKQTLLAQSPVRSIAFDNQGHIVSGSDDGTVKLWDAKSGQLKQTFLTTGIVWAVAFNNQGQIASGSNDGTVKLWDAKSGQLKQTLLAQSSVSSVAFDHQGHISSGSNDGTIRLWDIESGQLKQTFRAQSSVLSVAFDNQGQLVSGSDDGTVKLWDAKSGLLKQTILAHTDWIRSVAFDNQGQLASGSDDGTVRLWDAKSTQLKQTLLAQNSISSVAFDNQGHIASGSDDGTVSLWGSKSAQLKQTLLAGSSVNSVTFDNQGHIASGSDDGTIRLWDVKSGQLKQAFLAQGRIWSVAFDDQGHIGSGSSDGIIRLWDVKSGQLEQAFQTKNIVLSVDFDDRGHIASGSGEGTVRIWHAKSGQLKQTIMATGSILSVAFDDQGQIASGSDDGTISLWDVKSGQLKQTLQAKSPVWSVTFDNQGQIASGLSDGTIKLWDVQSGQLTQTLQAQSPVWSVAFGEKGQIASGSSDGTIKLWDASSHSSSLLLSTRHGSWISLFANNKVLRADNGQLLRKGEIHDQGITTIKIKETTRYDKEDRPIEELVERKASHTSWFWNYLMTPNSSVNVLQHSLTTNSIKLNSGETALFKVQLQNTGTTPIHHPHILEASNKTGELQIIPAEYQPTYPQTTAIYSSTSLIPPGETIELAARVISTSPIPPVSGEYTLPVIIEVSGGEQTTPMGLKVKLNTPDVVTTSSEYSSSNKTLNINLKNQGSAPLPLADFYLIDTENPNLQLPRQSLNTILPNSETALAFTLPDTIDKEQRNRLQLEIRPMKPPLYTQWYLPLEIKGMSAHLQALLALAIFSLLAFALWYIRRHQRYNHPLVTDLSSTPEQLLTLPLETLTEAQHRLSDTGHLGKVLEQQNISPQRLETAITFNTATAKDKAKILAERLYAQLEQPNEALHWLQLPDDFPLDVDDLLLFQPDATTPIEDIPNTLRQHMKHVPHLERPLCLLLSENSHYSTRLLRISEDYSNNLVTLTSRNLTQLLLSERPQAVLAKIIAEQVSLDQISPYQLGGGVDRETVFFGRRNLITRIMNRAPANYLLVGGRQLGKSSLLKALKRRYDKQRDVQCHYLVLKGETLQRDLSDVLHLSEHTALSELLTELRQRMTEQRYVFLIDEADDFIRAERDNNYTILKELRSLSETGQCTFVLAGFWQLYDYATLDYQSPLKNFGEILHLGELEEEACANLASIPMAMMNLHYASPALIQTLIHETGQRANLIATACHEIINDLPNGQHEITAGDVQRALDSDEVAGKLAGWGSSEADKQTQQLDRIVVYAGIQLEEFSYGELLAFLENKGFTPDANELQRSLDRLKLGFVLGEAKKQEKKHYHFRVPLFKRQLQEDEPDIRLRAELRSLGRDKDQL